MYQIIKPISEGQSAQYVKRIADNAFIPFDPANTDYQKFKQDLTNGAELQDADGVVMTAEQVQEFLETLP